MRRKSQLSTMFLIGLILMVWPVAAKAAGPWKAQLVDAETGKPLEGVVALAVWTKCGFITMDGCGEYYDSEEVVTGSDGRFAIQARWSLLRTIEGPEFKIFKPGYGQWQFQGSGDWPTDVYERKARVKKTWEQFASEGVVIELPPLKTSKERREFLRSVSWSPDVPWDQTKQMRDAKERERKYLGLD